MNRRGFLKGLGALVGGIAIEQAIPFNRVWSFPKEIKIAPTVIMATIEQYSDFVAMGNLATIYYDRLALDNLKRRFSFHSMKEPRQLPASNGQTLRLFRYQS